MLTTRPKTLRSRVSEHEVNHIVSFHTFISQRSLQKSVNVRVCQLKCQTYRQRSPRKQWSENSCLVLGVACREIPVWRVVAGDRMAVAGRERNVSTGADTQRIKTVNVIQAISRNRSLGCVLSSV